MHDHQIFVTRDTNPPPVLRIPMRISSQTLTLIDHTTANVQIRYFDPLLSTYTEYLSNSGDIQAITTLGTYQLPSTNKIRMDSIGGLNGGFIEIHLTTGKFSTAAKYFHLTVHVDGDDPIAATLRVDLELNGSVNGNVTGSVIGAVGTIGAGGISSTSIDPNIGLLPFTNGACQSGSTSGTVKLASGFTATNNLLIGSEIRIIAGTGAWQTRTILSYDDSTKVATIDRNWIITPAAGDTYAIFARDNPQIDSELKVTAGAATVSSINTGVINRAAFAADTGLQTLLSGTASAGGANTITIATHATAQYWRFKAVKLTGGTGAGQDGWIIDYNNGTGVATILGNWLVNPNNTTTYAILDALPYFAGGTIAF